MNRYLISHHGIEGQKWGVRNGPPYPLDYYDHSKAEQKHIRKYIDPRTGKLTKKGEKINRNVDKARSFSKEQLDTNKEQLEYYKTLVNETERVRKKGVSDKDIEGFKRGMAEEYGVDVRVSKSDIKKLFEENLESEYSDYKENYNNYKQICSVWLQTMDLLEKPIYSLSKLEISAIKELADAYDEEHKYD